MITIDQRSFVHHNGLINGYKCTYCGQEFEVLGKRHLCGDEHCMPKCHDCGQAEVNCRCSARDRV